MYVKSEIENILVGTIKDVFGVENAVVKFGLLTDFTQDTQFGDFTSNIAFKLAKELKKSPKEIANKIIDKFEKLVSIERLELAGNGYINFYLGTNYFIELFRQINGKGANFGRSSIGKNIKVNIEFCSANPTGPLTIAHGRQAAVGDTLARILKFASYDVTKEYYVNDCGNQINNLAKSVYCSYLELFGRKYQFPEEGYHGKYIAEFAKAIKNSDSDNFVKMEENSVLKAFAQKGVRHFIEQIKNDLRDFGVEFDVYFSQDKFEESGAVSELVKWFESNGLTYEKEGAVWLRLKDYGDFDDKVIIKSDGSFTYRTPDFAYHKDKFERGFTKVITLLGPDHHGHISDMLAALKMLYGDELDRKKYFHALVVQHCKLMRGGEEVKMSKRAATYVTLRELLDEIGRDVGRYFFVARKTDQHLDFDIDVAKKQNLENPAFYLQYAHARACSIFRKGAEENLLPKKLDIECDLPQEEIAIGRMLMRFPNIIESAAENLDAERLAKYLLDLAREFQSYYQKGSKDRKYSVLVADEKVRQMRLFVTKAFQTVLANGLALIGVSAPEQMESLSE